MTQTVGLQIKLGLVALLDAIPGVTAAHLNRSQPIGENETPPGSAVINVTDGGTTVNTDNQISLPQMMQLRVSVYLSVAVGGDPVDVLVDPYLQAINGIMHGPARSLPGVQGVTLVRYIPDAEGDSGRVDMFWNIMFRTSQLDLTQPSP